MRPLYRADVTTPSGDKSIAVYHCNVLEFPEPIDILTTSAFRRSYAPTPGTLFRALDRAGISVSSLAADPQLDLRNLCSVWLSREIPGNERIRRIGCIEMLGGRYGDADVQENLLSSLRSYFQMLDIASNYHIPMKTVALPLLGSGSQNISAELTMIPIINECVAFLKRNAAVERICFVELDPHKADLLARTLENSYLLLRQGAEPQPAAVKPQATVFLSYASGDKNIADNLCAKLERRNVKVWYAPRDVQGPYAAAITTAIERATHFVVILSSNSMQSQHVLNEIDLAFQNLPDKIKFKPLRIDEALFTPSMKYYLSRQHWMDAVDPPLEERLNEFVEKIKNRV